MRKKEYFRFVSIRFPLHILILVDVTLLLVVFALLSPPFFNPWGGFWSTIV